MLQITLLLGLVVGCDNTVAVRVQVCGPLSGDTHAVDDFADLTCATEARLRVYRDDIATPLTDRCIGLAGPTRLEDLFATHVNAGRARPLSLMSLDGHTDVAVEIGLYAPGSAFCPAEAPLLALGRSNFFDLSRQSSIPVPLAARNGCRDQTDGITLDMRRLEDLTPAPAPAFTVGEIYPYDSALSTSGVCRAPDTHRGQLRLFTAQQIVDANGPTNQVSGTIFFDHSGFAGCTVAHVDDDAGGWDACLGDDVSPHRAPIWLLGSAHVQAARAANLAVPNAQNGALVVRVVDPAAATDPVLRGSFVGARLTFNSKGPRNEADYVLDDAWTIAAAPGGTTAAGSGVAVFLDAPSGAYTVSFGDRSVVFNAGAAADPRAVTVFLISR